MQTRAGRSLATPDDVPVSHGEQRTEPAAGSGERIAVVIPCFRVARHVLGVIARIGPECRRIYVVDDACPEGSGDLVAARCTDPRVQVIRHRKNLGVGAAVMSGYRAALN